MSEVTVTDARDDGKRQRRDPRGFGPFTGAQLTTIVVALIVVVGFPFAAFAVTGSNIFITDAKTGKTAKISGAGRLSTTANVVYPMSSIILPGPQQAPACLASGTCAILAPAQAGRTTVITSVHIDFAAVPTTPTASDFIDILDSDDGTCFSSSGFHEYDFVDAKERGLVTLDYPLPSGLVVPEGHSLCVGSGDAALSAFVSATGFTVPTNTLPATTATPTRHVKMRR